MHRGDQDILEHRHVGEGFRDLIGAADADAAAVPWLHPGDIAPVQQDSAAARRQHAANQVEQRALAGSVRSQDAENLPGLDCRSRPSMTRRPPNARDNDVRVSMFRADRRLPVTSQAIWFIASAPCSGTFGTWLLSTITSSSGHCLPLRHCPETHLVSLVLGNGPVRNLPVRRSICNPLSRRASRIEAGIVKRSDCASTCRRRLQSARGGSRGPSKPAYCVLFSYSVAYSIDD